MTPAEYLRARGWESLDSDAEDDFWWTHPRHPSFPGTLRKFVIADAVALQVAEDRACYNFVRERSATRGGLLVEPEP